VSVLDLEAKAGALAVRLLIVHGTDGAALGSAKGPTNADSRDAGAAASHTSPAMEPVLRHDFLAIPGQKWWQPKSEFHARLNTRIHPTDADPQIGLDVEAFTWTGENAEEARDSASDRLADRLADLARQEVRVHILAHSHGGNVARGAVERLASRGNAFALKGLGSVTSFGTPYFRYNAWPRIMGSLVRISLGVGVALAALAMILAPRGSLGGVLPIRGFLTMPVIGAAALMSLTLIAGSAPRLSRSWTFLRGQKEIRRWPLPWINLLSSRDEVLQLLSSFNRPIELMRRNRLAAGELPIPPWVLGFLLGTWIAIGVVVDRWLRVSIPSPVAAWITAHVRNTPDSLKPLGYQVDLVILSAIGSGLAFFALVLALGGTLIFVRNLWRYCVDKIVTDQLRRIACGDNGVAVITGVAATPWTWASRAEQALSAAVDSEIEGRVAELTAPLWARMRKGFVPGVAYSEQNLLGAVIEALTWDELAHTTYTHSDGFIATISKILCDTGDFAQRS
jgi:hypothetical protein